MQEASVVGFHGDVEGAQTAIKATPGSLIKPVGLRPVDYSLRAEAVYERRRYNVPHSAALEVPDRSPISISRCSLLDHSS